MQGFLRFNKGLWRMPMIWKIWVMMLMVCNAILPLLLISYIEAQITLGAFAVAGLLMSYITTRVGFTRLLGLGHFVWFPLIVYLWPTMMAASLDTLFGIWVSAVIFINGISLLIDVADVIRYIAGDRAETVQGLQAE